MPWKECKPMDERLRADEDVESGLDPQLRSAGGDLGGVVDDERGGGADHLLGAVAEHPLGPLVEDGDRTCRVGGDDRVLGGRAEHGGGLT